MNTPPTSTLDDLNALDEAGFIAALDGVVEHAPWVAGRIAHQRPFLSLADLHVALVRAIRQAPAGSVLTLLNGHPELAGREAAASALTAASSSEQSRLGLLSLSREQHRTLSELNAAYRQRYGFPYIVALRLHDALDSVFADLRQRLARDTLTEMDTALQQVAEVISGRLDRLVVTARPIP